MLSDLDSISCVESLERHVVNVCILIGSVL